MYIYIYVYIYMYVYLLYIYTYIQTYSQPGAGYGGYAGSAPPEARPGILASGAPKMCKNDGFHGGFMVILWWFHGI